MPLRFKTINVPKILLLSIIFLKIHSTSSYELINIQNNDLRGGGTAGKAPSLGSSKLQQQQRQVDINNNIDGSNTNIESSSLPEITYKPVLIGKISTFLKTLAIDFQQMKDIWIAIQRETHMVDIFVIGTVGWIVRPAFDFITQHLRWWKKKKNINMSTDSISENRHDKTRWSFVVDALSEISKIASLVYAIDILDIILTELGFEFAKKYEFSHFAAKTFYTIWAAKMGCKFKHNLIQKEQEKHKYFPAKIVSNVSNAVIYTISSLILLDTYNLRIGVAFSSLFAFGGVGTLVFSLASKDFATELFNGMISSASQKYDVGDKILLGDGTYGHVTRLGWYDMDVLGDDSLEKRIPYSQVGKKSVVNMTRNKRSQVKQTLRFQYKDLDIVDDMINDIKLEVKATCPKLITDGSRSFRVFIYSFEPDHIAVVLNTHYDIRPRSNEHYKTRHDVCKAVARVMKKYNTTFALPVLVSVMEK